MTTAHPSRHKAPPVFRTSTIVAVIPVLVLATAVLQVLIAQRNGTFETTDDLLFSIIALPYGIVGALIVGYRGHNTVGWIFCAMAVLSATGGLALEWVPYAYDRSGDTWGVVLAAWYGEWYWLPFISLLIVFTPLLFPDGRTASARWRPVLWIAVSLVTLFTVLAALDPSLEIVGRRASLENPIGFSPLGDVEDGPESGFMFLGIIAISIAGVFSLFLRMRRAEPGERQQIKWFVYGTVMLVAGFILFAAADSLGVPRSFLDLAYSLVFTLPPITSGVAILRYRLYDIDVLINRTLVYGTLSAILATAYIGCIVVFQQVLPLAQDSDVAVAASTLAVAAVVRPARARIQAFIDRRFYRSRYDAAATLSSFSDRVRQRVDLEGVRTTLLESVAETVAPARLSLWLRDIPPERQILAKKS